MKVPFPRRRRKAPKDPLTELAVFLYMFILVGAVNSDMRKIQARVRSGVERTRRRAHRWLRSLFPHRRSSKTTPS